MVEFAYENPLMVLFLSVGHKYMRTRSEGDCVHWVNLWIVGCLRKMVILGRVLSTRGLLNYALTGNYRYMISWHLIYNYLGRDGTNKKEIRGDLQEAQCQQGFKRRVNIYRFVKWSKGILQSQRTTSNDTQDVISRYEILWCNATSHTSFIWQLIWGR